MIRFKRTAAALLAVCLLFAGSTAFAAPLTAVEQTFLEFQKAVADQLVKDGEITRQMADTYLARVQKELENSPEDVIYKRIKEKGLFRFQKMDKTVKPSHNGVLVKTYAQMTGRSAQEIEKSLQDEKLTVWQLAAREGKLEELEEKALAHKAARLDGLVRAGKITQQERDDKLSQYKEKLKSMQP